MSPKEFVESFKKDAIECENQSGISAIAILAQAAHESGWGKFAVGNMFFGVKDTDGVNGNEQLLTTTEVLSTPNAKFPFIQSITKIGANLYKYVVKDYFRKYDTAEQCFDDHAKFFLENSRYRYAWNCRGDAEQFLREVAKAGYATAPDYEKQLIDTLRWFQKNS